MPNRISRGQAVEALQVLDAEHARADYYLKSEVVPVDIGYGVDVRVDREKWEDAKQAQGVQVSLISLDFNGVPICVLLVG